MGIPELAFAGGQPQRPSRSTLLVRVIGIYIAAGAGAIQFLDILVDRTGLPVSDRFFMMAVLFGIIGIPFAGAGAALYDMAARERVPPRRADSQRAPVVATARGPAKPPVARPAEGQSVDAAALPRRLELALSYRRIAELHEETGDDEAARVQRSAWLREASSISAELRRLIDEDG